GAKGIGLATAETFVREGARVIIADRDRQAGMAVAAKLGPASLFVEADVSQSPDVQQMVTRGLEHFGRIDFLVNNAAIIKYATVETCTEEEWDEVLNINLKAAFLCSKYAIPTMKSDGGVVINVASAQSFISSSNMVHYTTAKSAL